MLNKRQEKIIIVMQESKDWVVGRELANLMGVSDRTIRSDIVKINKFYEDILIESNLKYGYRINKDKIKSLNIELTEIIPQTPEERCIYILQELLFEKNEINIIFLQDKVFISEYSIDNDIKKIKRMIEPYSSLKIIKSKNYIKLVGKEEEKRKLYKDLLTSETKGNFLNLNKIASLYKDFDLIEVKDILEDTFKEYNYHIRELAFPMLMIHIGIAIERIIKHNYIKTDRNTEELQNSIEYKIAQVFFKKVAENIRIEIVEDEIVLLALLLLGKKSANYTNDVVKDQTNYSVSDLVEETLLDIKKIFNVDFTSDNDLKIGLEMHIMSLLERQIKNIEIDNMYLQEIKRKYPLIFEMAVRVCKLLEEKIHINIKENEIAFIALHLGAAYERANLTCKYKVIMIYPNTQALSNLCLQKILNRFGDRIDIIESMNFFEESVILRLKPDLILTTLPLKHSLDILTLQISLFVDYEDESRIFQALNNLDRLRCREDFKLLILKLVKEEFFYTHVNVKSSFDLITRMCDNLYKKGYVKKDFKSSVLQREKMSATSFAYGFAIPHSFNGQISNKSSLSIAILDNPIKWGDFDVRFVILFAVKEEDHRILRVFFDWLSNVISNSSKFASLLEVKNYKEFINQVLK
ncbi:transcriptional antiterminator BglG [Clostridium fallax]|uniref:Lichenan operon transcriptional antiterminator n=1 Tax=Clostridium fallax TaxID=1533 RepID=A0A1M4YGH3_9CLOT|nr:BglG family transcription antiterminator [Clostridium fallax]SHF04789.1 lichenan operon transcriptional antiterminator [Clostridium fallax]SQB22335.1 transcriptional antiterminator BglG [Clostridium fallax]